VKTNRDPCEIEPDRLVDYLLGELPAGEAERLEGHFFECAACAAKIESIERIGTTIADVTRHASVGANVNGAFVDRAARDGLTLREYRIPAGETVACAAGPEDLVVIRLAANFGGATDLSLDVTFHDLENDETSPAVTRQIVADRDLSEVVLVFPGELVRTYPRSRWTLRVGGELPSGRAEFGPFIMDHTP
jgi:anti-sigma factor RsiW